MLCAFSRLGVGAYAIDLNSKDCSSAILGVFSIYFSIKPTLEDHLII